jgi:hypothetical protein
VVEALVEDLHQHAENNMKKGVIQKCNFCAKILKWDVQLWGFGSLF